jgi:hypothetical protein
VYRPLFGKHIMIGQQRNDTYNRIIFTSETEFVQGASLLRFMAEQPMMNIITLAKLTRILSRIRQSQITNYQLGVRTLQCRQKLAWHLGGCSRKKCSEFFERPISEPQLGQDGNFWTYAQFNASPIICVNAAAPATHRIHDKNKLKDGLHLRPSTVEYSQDTMRPNTGPDRASGRRMLVECQKEGRKQDCPAACKEDEMSANHFRRAAFVVDVKFGCQPCGDAELRGNISACCGWWFDEEIVLTSKIPKKMRRPKTTISLVRTTA